MRSAHFDTPFRKDEAMRKIILPAALLLGGGLAAGALTPQTAAVELRTVQTQQQPQPNAVSEKDAEAFASATIAVQEVSQRWQPDIAGAGSATEQMEMRQQAEQEMIGEIQKNGLTLDDYNRIYTVAMQDPGVQEMVKQFIRQKREGQKGG